MKAGRSILVIFLLVIIFGGIGYIGWSFFSMSGGHQGMVQTPSVSPAPNNETQSGMNNMQEMDENQVNQTQGNEQHAQNNEQQAKGNEQNQNNQPFNTQNVLPLNSIAIQNREKLIKSIETVNQAIDLITMDPYSKTTLPSVPDINQTPIQSNTNQTQPTQGNGNINIYPSGNSSVNVTPNGTIAPNNTPPANMNQGTTTKPSQNYVYDQSKLQQLHNGIYTLAQGMSEINDLAEELLAQAAIIEDNPINYQTFVFRYNTALKNKTRLDNAINKLSQASVLINVNPYASQNGYSYNVDAMGQLNQGIFKLAQGISSLNKLNESFESQMVQASASGQYFLRATNQTNNNDMVPDSMQGHNQIGNISVSTVVNIILIVLLFGLIIGILGAIVSMLKGNKRKIEEGSEVKNDEK